MSLTINDISQTNNLENINSKINLVSINQKLGQTISAIGMTDASSGNSQIYQIVSDNNNKLEYHISYANNIIFSNYNISDWSFIQNNNSTILRTNTEAHFNTSGIYSGTYNILYQPYINILGDFDMPTLYIDEISDPRHEVRLKLFNDTAENIKKLKLAATLPLQDDQGNILGLYLNFKNNVKYTVVNWLSDPDNENSIIYRFLNPLPDDIQDKDTCVVCLPLCDEVNFDVTIHSADSPQDVTILANPNWQAKVYINKSKKETDFYNWDTLLASNPTSSYRLINEYLSGSLTGIDLNIDYSQYENYVFYSSAGERLNNFKYKLQLIENYTNLIDQLNIQVSSSLISDTITINRNIIKYDDKLKAVLGTFDGYENYMYYQSSSLMISSSTWPKINSTPPYILYPVNSDFVENWFDDQISSATLYDTNNINNLLNTIPTHIQLDTNNVGYIIFIEMVAQHFDILWLYISHINNIYNRKESLYEGLSKDLVYNALKSFGWDPEFGTQFEDLWYATFGGNTNNSGEYIQIDSEKINPTPAADISKQVWKRILNNLPFLLKNKGTAAGIRALINCYGIPDTILRIREYGGPDKENHQSKYTYDKFGYSWAPNSGSNYYLNISGSTFPETLEFRFKTIDASNKILTTDQKNQVIFTGISGSFATTALQLQYQKNQFGDLILLVKSIASPNYIQYSIPNIPVYDGNWWSVMLRHNSNLDYTLYIKQSNGTDVTLNYSSSFTISAFESSSLSYCNLTFPGNKSSTSNPTYYPFGYFNGNLQEIRLWNTPLSESAFNNHTTAPIAFNGNTLTSSYYDLVFRLPLGTEAYLSSSLQLNYSGSSVNYYTESKQPNIYYNPYTVIAQPLTMSFQEVVEMQSIAWPDASSNRQISNKIRVENNNAFNGNALDLKRRTELGAFDLYPTDSPKIGVYMSPTNEINEDIAQQMGGFRIDDFIGDEEDYYTDEYKDLISLRNQYFKKYTGRPNFEQYIRLLKFYDYSLFNQIKNMIPARSKGLIGLVIEPHILERPKFKLMKKPICEDVDLYTKIDAHHYVILNGSNPVYTGSMDGHIYKINSEYTQLESNNIPLPFNLISDIQELSTNDISLNNTILAGDTETLYSGINFQDYMNMSGIIPNTLVTASSLSSTKYTIDLTIEDTPWISSSVANEVSKHSISSLNIPYSGSYGCSWFVSSTENIFKTNYNFGSSTTGHDPNTRNEDVSAVLNIQDYEYNWELDRYYSINGIKIKIRKYLYPLLGSHSCSDYIIKLGYDDVDDLTLGQNKADTITPWPDFEDDIDYYYGGINDMWGLSNEKGLIKKLHSGFSIKTKYPIGVLHPFDPSYISYHAIKVYFNIQNLKLAEISDFEPTDLANLRYLGCKVISTDFNQPCPDTPDGGPAVEFSLINPTTIIVSPNPGSISNPVLGSAIAVA